MRGEAMSKGYKLSIALAIISLCLVGCGEPKKEYSDPVYNAFYAATGIEPEAAVISTSGDTWLIIEYDISKTPYDYADYVSIGLSDYINTAFSIFTDTSFTTLRMDMLYEGQAVTSLIMDKDAFSQYAWEDLKYTKGIYYDISDDFNKFYIESMILNGIDANDIEYKTVHRSREDLSN